MIIHDMIHFNDSLLIKMNKMCKIEIKVDVIQLYDIPSTRTQLIMGILFFTTKGRTSQSIDDVKGDTISRIYIRLCYGKICKIYSSI